MGKLTKENLKQSRRICIPVARCTRERILKVCGLGNIQPTGQNDNSHNGNEQQCQDLHGRPISRRKKITKSHIVIQNNTKQAFHFYLP